MIAFQGLRAPVDLQAHSAGRCARRAAAAATHLVRFLSFVPSRYTLDSSPHCATMPMMNRRAVLLAAAACIAAVTLGGGLFPAVGVFGTWRLASTGWRLWQLAGSGEFHPVGRNKDVLRCRRRLRCQSTVTQLPPCPPAGHCPAVFGPAGCCCPCFNCNLTFGGAERQARCPASLQ